MPDQMIDNPAGAFGPLVDPSAPPGRPGYRYVDVYNTSANLISAGEWVQLDIASGATHQNGVIRGLAAGTLVAALGIALDNIPAGKYGRVITEGPALALAAATGVTAGQLALPSGVNNGQVTSTAGGTLGQILGVVQQTQAVQGAQFWVWVMRM